VTGAKGVLGRRVIAALGQAGHEAVGSGHFDAQIEHAGIVQRVAYDLKPDAIINCAGVTPGSKHNDLDMIAANATGPHVLASLGIEMIHMSTDCVFSGKWTGQIDGRGWHSDDDNPDPDTLYGRTKLVGEVAASYVLNVRGSFVDWEGGLLQWFRTTEERPIPLWKHAYWNGGMASEMAEALVNLLTADHWGKTIHVARAPIRVNKALLLYGVAERMGDALRSDDFQEQGSPSIYRELRPTVELPPWEDFWKRLEEEWACLNRPPSQSLSR
jgi:dTDP-4-dehydrorhamnose reductase